MNNNLNAGYDPYKQQVTDNKASNINAGLFDKKGGALNPNMASGGNLVGNKIGYAGPAFLQTQQQTPQNALFQAMKQFPNQSGFNLPQISQYSINW